MGMRPGSIMLVEQRKLALASLISVMALRRRLAGNELPPLRCGVLPTDGGIK